MRKPLTGEPCAGELHARFGGRGGAGLLYPYLDLAATCAPTLLLRTTFLGDCEVLCSPLEVLIALKSRLTNFPLDTVRHRLLKTLSGHPNRQAADIQTF